LLAALRRFFAALVAPPPAERRLLLEAQTKARTADASTLIVLVEAAYLPHGGRDRLALELTEGGHGRIARTRTAERRDPGHVERALAADETALVLAELGRRSIWTLRDEHELVMDGLVVEFAFAQADRSHALTLRCGSADSELKRLFGFLFELAKLRDSE